MDYSEGPTTQRPLNLDDDSDSEFEIQEVHETINLPLSEPTGATCSVENEESQGISADSRPSTSPDGSHE